MLAAYILNITSASDTSVSVSDQRKGCCPSPVLVMAKRRITVSLVAVGRMSGFLVC